MERKWWKGSKGENHRDRAFDHWRRLSNAREVNSFGACILFIWGLQVHHRTWQHDVGLITSKYLLGTPFFGNIYEAATPRAAPTKIWVANSVRSQHPNNVSLPFFFNTYDRSNAINLWKLVLRVSLRSAFEGKCSSGVPPSLVCSWY